MRRGPHSAGTGGRGTYLVHEAGLHIGGARPGQLEEARVVALDNRLRDVDSEQKLRPGLYVLRQCKDAGEDL